MKDAQVDELKKFIARSNEEQLEDLKQFVNSKISQSEARLIERMDNGFKGVGDALEIINNINEKRFKKLEKTVGVA